MERFLLVDQCKPALHRNVGAGFGLLRRECEVDNCLMDFYMRLAKLCANSWYFS
jgi:hypothetical protein